mmetsp:Transcript_85375/g.226649  ORF Transcript_85375/g.226649 Transcript_85375/m.226649 type:complete len:131 (+) Transcript_85375:1069-1461(+)
MPRWTMLLRDKSEAIAKAAAGKAFDRENKAMPTNITFRAAELDCMKHEHRKRRLQMVLPVSPISITGFRPTVSTSIEPTKICATRAQIVEQEDIWPPMAVARATTKNLSAHLPEPDQFLLPRGAAWQALS